jgi:ribosomal protein L24E|tara:strand:+ start:4215 stop:4457 length:243 start_codon:yes stop_codon:yes gene_type:complete
MPECSYCGKLYDLHKGLTLVLKDGNIKHLCSSKCKKNMLMKRRKVRWISKSKKGNDVEKGEIKETPKKEEKIEKKEEEKK